VVLIPWRDKEGEKEVREGRRRRKGRGEKEGSRERGREKRVLGGVRESDRRQGRSNSIDESKYRVRRLRCNEDDEAAVDGAILAPTVIK
jgi:hypothetical protein